MVQLSLFVFAIMSLCAGSISGLVTDQSGAVIAGSKIIAVSESGEKAEAFADRVGRFSILDLKAGTYTIEVSCAGFRNKVINSFRVLAEQDTRLPPIELSVAPLDFGCKETVSPMIVFTPVDSASSEIAGRVFSGTTKPASGARVAVYAMQSTRELRSAQADASGNFTVRRLPTGTYQIRVHFPGHAELIIDGVEVRTGFRSEGSSFNLTPCHQGTACSPVKWAPPPMLCL